MDQLGASTFLPFLTYWSLKATSKCMQSVLLPPHSLWHFPGLLKVSVMLNNNPSTLTFRESWHTVTSSKNLSLAPSMFLYVKLVTVISHKLNSLLVRSYLFLCEQLLWNVLFHVPFIQSVLFFKSKRVDRSCLVYEPWFSYVSYVFHGAVKACGDPQCLQPLLNVRFGPRRRILWWSRLLEEGAREG